MGERHRGVRAVAQAAAALVDLLEPGTAYFYLKRYPDAVKAFEQAAALNPNDAITMGNLADGLRWSGQRDRALNVYATAISLAYKDLQVNPKDATTLAMVGLYQAKSGKMAGRWSTSEKRVPSTRRGAALLSTRPWCTRWAAAPMPRWRRCRRHSTAAIQSGRWPKTPSWRCSRSLRLSHACCTADGAVSERRQCRLNLCQRVDLRRRLEMSAAPRPSPVPSNTRLAGSGTSVANTAIDGRAVGEPDQLDEEVAAAAHRLESPTQVKGAIPPPAKCAPNSSGGEARSIPPSGSSAKKPRPPPPPGTLK